MARIGISIVNWNTGELLARCLKSLAALPAAEQEHIAEVIVVDNKSHDRSIAQAKLAVAESNNRPRVRFVLLNENAGFARANNVAIDRIRQGQGEGCHVLLLNPDTEVRPGALPAILAVLQRHERAGIVGPRLLNSDGTLQPSVRSFPNVAVFIFLFLKLHRLFPGAELWRRYMLADFDYTREQQVDQVMGAAFLIRRQALDQLVGLDEKFWVWFEEVDFCKRAASGIRQLADGERNWQTWYTPAGEVTHHGGVSFGQLTSWRRAVPWIQSSLIYARKHLALWQQAILWLLAPVALLLSIPAGLLRKVE